MYKVMREVNLPDGTTCFEVETHVVGSSETQLAYEYIKVSGRRVDKSKFATDYWGRIKDIRIL